MPISIVAFATYESLYFSSSVAGSVLGRGPREVPANPVSHLVRQLFAPLGPHLLARAKVQTSAFVVVSIGRLLPRVCAVRVDACLGRLPNVQHIGC